MSKLTIDLELELEEELTLADPGLVGCRRRGRWDYEDHSGAPPWRRMRGNAILSTVGSRERIGIPGIGTLEFYIHNTNHDAYLLQFRGGPWNLDWTEEFFDLWTLVYDMRVKAISRTILVLHENKSDLDIKEVKVPEDFQANTRLTGMITEYTATPPGRIPKSGPRAIRLCPHCPHKQRCDAEDILQDQTSDWSPSYPTP